MIPPPPTANTLGRIGPPPSMPYSCRIAALPAVLSIGAAAAFSESDLSSLIDAAEKMVTEVLGGGYAVSLDVLGDIDLPPAMETQVDRAQLRALAALYLAAALEPAGVISSAERLAALAASGSFRLDLGDAAPLLHDFWRSRYERIDASERAAFFGRLFGPSYGQAPAEGVANIEFDALMVELCEALYRLDEFRGSSPHGGIAQQSRVRAAGRYLLGNLVNAGGGVTAFLAEEILKVLKLAIGLLSHEHLRRAFMARDIWGVINRINDLARQGSSDHRTYVRRGQAGMNVIAWLADAAPSLSVHGAPLVRLDHAVIPAALDWLQASLLISERINLQTPPSNPVTGAGPDSPWAAIGF